MVIPADLQKVPITKGPDTTNGPDYKWSLLQMVPTTNGPGLQMVPITKGPEDVFQSNSSNKTYIRLPPKISMKGNHSR